MLGLLDLLSFGGERARLSLLLLNGLLVCLDLAVHLGVELALFTQLLQHLVLVGALRGLERQITLTLLYKKWKMISNCERKLGGTLKKQFHVYFWQPVHVLIMKHGHQL